MKRNGAFEFSFEKPTRLMRETTFLSAWVALSPMQAVLPPLAYAFDVVDLTSYNL